MKKSAIVLLILAFMLMLSGCICFHEWYAADCVTPKTCAKCGKTDGEPLGHTWVDATCTQAQYCEVCKVEEGEPLPHTWVDATCSQAQYCEVCALEEGEPLPHTWLDATTETPMTCEVCALTEGERIITDARFTTAANEKIFGKWGLTLDLTGEALGAPGINTVVPFDLYYTFNNDGTFDVGIDIDPEAFLDLMVQVSIETLYAEFEAEGFSKAQAEEAIKSAYGTDIESAMRKELEAVNIGEMINAMFGAIQISGVYYIDGELLYTGLTWDGELTGEAYTLTEDTLSIASMQETMSEFGSDIVMQRIVEEESAA